MKNNIKILFVSPGRSSFVETDEILLGKHFDLKIIEFIIRKRNLFGKLTLIGMVKDILSADMTFSWFAGLHAYYAVRLSKIFGKKSIVIVGGYEIADLPEIGYGAMLDSKTKSIASYVLSNSDRVIAISVFNKNEINKYTSKNNIRHVYMGVDHEKFTPNGQKENLVITVAVITESSIKRKGLETFIKSAENLPDVRFVLIGGSPDNSVDTLRLNSPKNVEFTGYVPVESLIKLYQRAKVYCQLSLHEGFGMSLAEAMCCECVPVITDNGAMPEVVGDTGFYVPFEDPKETSNAIKEALDSDKGRIARKRIVENFSLEKREKDLVWEIRNLLN